MGDPLPLIERDIVDYLTRYGSPIADDQDDDIALIQALDDVWLAHARQQAEQNRNKSGGG